MNDEDLDFTTSILNSEQLYELEVIKIEKESIMKNHFAHEIGHLIGLLVNDLLTEPFGIPNYISFKKDNAAIKYNWTDGVFRVLSYEVGEDFYKQKGFKVNSYRKECKQTQEYINKSYNLNRFPSFILYLLMGGLWDLYIDSIIKDYKVEEKHFFRLFSDKIEEVSPSISGAAGNDWTKVRMYCGEYKIPYDVLIKFRKDLYWLCLHNGLFSHFESLIDQLFNKGQLVYSKEEFTELIKKVKLHLDGYLLLEVSFLTKINELNSHILNLI